LNKIRTGIGFDVHRFAEGRKLIIGGVEIPHTLGLLGHSDADVLLHAIADALLGSLALGDIGMHFPDTDETFKDADSKELLKKVNSIVTERGYRVGNVDCMLMMQSPKISPYTGKMREIIAEILGIDAESVSIKATTTEHLGFVGRGEGATAMATVLVEKI
jgi:2-C-methyl-D-erythritol 2,4-cyclodiphosphate synthase